jgi:hypothetical protein
LCFFVLVQFVAPVFHALDVQPHAEDAFLFGVCLLVAGPVIPGSHVPGEFVQALVPPFFVVGLAGPLFPTDTKKALPAYSFD